MVVRHNDAFVKGSLQDKDNFTQGVEQWHRFQPKQHKTPPTSQLT